MVCIRHVAWHQLGEARSRPTIPAPPLARLPQPLARLRAPANIPRASPLRLSRPGAWQARRGERGRPGRGSAPCQSRPRTAPAAGLRSTHAPQATRPRPRRVSPAHAQASWLAPERFPMSSAHASLITAPTKIGKTYHQGSTTRAASEEKERAASQAKAARRRGIVHSSVSPLSCGVGEGAVSR